jgi:hypothetical protein
MKVLQYLEQMMMVKFGLSHLTQLTQTTKPTLNGFPKAIHRYQPKVWDAMEMSGSPCPMGGAVGFTAKKAWYEKDPEKFRKLYGPNYTLPTPSTTKE